MWEQRSHEVTGTHHQRAQASQEWPALVSAEIVPGKGPMWTQQMASCVSTQQGTPSLYLGLLIRNGYWLLTRPLLVKVTPLQGHAPAASPWFFL